MAVPTRTRKDEVERRLKPVCELLSKVDFHVALAIFVDDGSRPVCFTGTPRCLNAGHLLENGVHSRNSFVDGLRATCRRSQVSPCRFKNVQGTDRYLS